MDAISLVMERYNSSTFVRIHRYIAIKLDSIAQNNKVS